MRNFLIGAGVIVLVIASLCLVMSQWPAGIV